MSLLTTRKHGIKQRLTKGKLRSKGKSKGKSRPKTRGKTISNVLKRRNKHGKGKNPGKKSGKKPIESPVKSPRDYRGLWKPQPKPIEQMKNDELISELKAFRDAWEYETKISQDLDDTRLEHDTTHNKGMLQELLTQYYSEDNRQNARKLIHRKYGNNN